MTTILFSPITWAKLLIRNLWLSVSSIEFYRDVFNVYDGYGVRYILTISFISSFLCSIVLLNQVADIQNYFTHNAVSNNVANIDHIISQFPDLSYDGNNISSVGDSSIIYLNSINNNKVVAIDPANNLSPGERNKIPIILTSNKIVISIISPGNKPLFTTSIPYNKFFIESEQTIDQTILKSSLADSFKNAHKIFIYLFFPFLGFLIFCKILIEKAFIIVVMFLLANIFSINASMKTCIRLIFFASGIFYLLQPLIQLTIPALDSIFWLVQIWTILLMILGVLKANNRF